MYAQHAGVRLYLAVPSPIKQPLERIADAARERETGHGDGPCWRTAKKSRGLFEHVQ
jgi:hypothetical protein